MISMFKMNFRLFLFLILILPFPVFGQTPARLSQNQSTKSVMTKKDVLQMATLLMALKQKYSMIDQDPDSDFLIFTREDDELDFFPKRALPKQMEALGLLVNKGEEEPVRRPSTHHEWDDKTAFWKEITSEGWIFYRYQITAKGQKFLRDAPAVLGHAVTPLKLASYKSVEEHTRHKTLTEITYDSEVQKKMHDEFIQIALNQFEALFSPAKSDKPEGQLPEGFSCGPNLWAKIETEAIKNGVHAGSLRAVYSYRKDTGESGSVKFDRPEKGISSRAQVILFRKTLFQVFPASVTPSIRELSQSESARYQDPQDAALQMSPLFMPSADFFVEYDQLRFLVKVRNEATADFLKISPKVSLIELIEHP